MLSFVSAVVSQYTINPNCVRAAVIRYTSATEVVIHLSSYSDESRLVLAIGQIPSRSGISNLAVALDLLRTQVFASNAVRSNTARIAIIVTDNLQPTSQITQAANNVRSQGITLVGVGITSPGPMDFNTLRSLTSNSWAIQVNSYGELISGARNTIVQQYCFAYTAPPTTTTTTTTTTTSAPSTCCLLRVRLNILDANHHRHLCLRHLNSLHVHARTYFSYTLHRVLCVQIFVFLSCTFEPPLEQSAA